MSLELSEQPGFTDLASSAFNTGAALTAEVLKALLADAKFAAVRDEQFWGYYKHGETVAVPTSPADGYAYSRAELRYSWSVYWTGAAPGAALEGTQSTPARGATSGAGQMLAHGASVDQGTGAVTIDTHYYQQGGAQTNTHDGILVVVTHAQRDR